MLSVAVLHRALPIPVYFLLLLSLLFLLKFKLYKRRGLVWLTGSPCRPRATLLLAHSRHSIINSFKLNNFQDSYCHSPGKAEVTELGRTRYSFHFITSSWERTCAFRAGRGRLKG